MSKVQDFGIFELSSMDSCINVYFSNRRKSHIKTKKCNVSHHITPQMYVIFAYFLLLADLRGTVNRNIGNLISNDCCSGVMI